MALMLGNAAVEAVLKRINAAKIEKSTTDTKTTQYIRAYKYEKGTKETGEYIAVNHLPFTHGRANTVAQGVVNVNVHVPILKSGELPTKRLSEICTEVINLFPDDTFIDGAYYDFYADSRPTLDNDETYYVNLQIQVTYNNLHTEELAI